MPLGIPDRKRITPLPHFDKPQIWEYVIQEHDAKRAGLHYDLRLVDPQSNIAHSWAVRHLPEQPGQKSGAWRQPDHTQAYTKFQGTLTDGYGKGTVKIYKAGSAEVLKSDAHHFRFNIYDGTRTIRYSLINTGGDNWLFYNHTPTEASKPYIPRSKPSFKSVEPSSIKYDDANQVIAPKIDGAANIFDLRGSKGVDVYSYRPSKKSSELIDHTYRIKANEIKLPNSLKDITLMGEVFATDKDGKALPPQDTTGALVSNVWKARNKVPGFGIALYDVLRYKGQPYSDKPYKEKLSILSEISSQVPALTLPPLAYTPEQKRQLINQVSFKQHPLTEEGFVVYDLDKSLPTKAKFKEDYDVYIREIHYGQGKHSGRMGYIRYSYTPSGPIVGKVGGGFSDELRQKMADRPKDYIGKPIRVYALGKTTGGALKVPQFKDFRTAEMFPKTAAKDSSLAKDFLAGADPTGVFTFRHGATNTKDHTKHRIAGNVGGFVGGALVSTALGIAGLRGLGKALGKKSTLGGYLTQGAKDQLSLFNPKKVFNTARNLPEAADISKKSLGLLDDTASLKAKGIHSSVKDGLEIMQRNTAYRQRVGESATTTLHRGVAMAGGIATGTLGGVLNASSAHAQYGAGLKQNPNYRKKK